MKKPSIKSKSRRNSRTIYPGNENNGFLMKRSSSKCNITTFYPVAQQQKYKNTMNRINAYLKTQSVKYILNTYR